jgi:hypothetical protein
MAVPPIHKVLLEMPGLRRAEPPAPHPEISKVPTLALARRPRAAQRLPVQPTLPLTLIR